nr:MAG TPA: hypothetical protein [Caudoviricetes sp.]
MNASDSHRIPRGEGKKFEAFPSDTGRSVVFLHRQFRKFSF